MADTSQLGVADIGLSTPPPLPADSVYTSCYCEENVYLLAQTFSRLSGWDPHAVFISNATKSVRAVPEPVRFAQILFGTLSCLSRVMLMPTRAAFAHCISSDLFIPVGPISRVQR